MSYEFGVATLGTSHFRHSALFFGIVKANGVEIFTGFQEIAEKTRFDSLANILAIPNVVPVTKKENAVSPAGFSVPGIRQANGFFQLRVAAFKPDVKLDELVFKLHLKSFFRVVVKLANLEAVGLQCGNFLVNDPDGTFDAVGPVSRSR